MFMEDFFIEYGDLTFKETRGINFEETKKSSLESHSKKTHSQTVFHETSKHNENSRSTKVNECELPGSYTEPKYFE